MIHMTFNKAKRLLRSVSEKSTFDFHGDFKLRHNLLLQKQSKGLSVHKLSFQKKKTALKNIKVKESY